MPITFDNGSWFDGETPITTNQYTAADGKTYLLVDQMGGGSFSSIQSAVNAAESGHTILVAPATYAETVNVDVSVEIRSVNNAGVAGSSDARGAESVVLGGIFIGADGVTIDGMSIQGGSPFPGETSVGIFIQANDVTVTNTVLQGTEGSRIGILTSTTASQNVEISDNLATGWVYGSYINPITTGTIEGNVLRGNGTGLGIDNPAVTITGNIFDGSETQQIEAYVYGASIDLEAVFRANNTFQNSGQVVVNVFAYGNGQTINGSAAGEVINGNDTDEVLNGGAGNDTVNGAGGSDTINGGEGDDVLNGGNDDDTIIGGAGNDILNGGTGDDALAGGAGNDIYVVDSADDTVTEAADGGTDTVRTSVSLTLAANVENLEAASPMSEEALVLTGNDGDNTITGNAGANTLDGGLGADTLIGLGGDDTYVVDNADDMVVETENGGTDTVLTSVTYTLGLGVENLTGTGIGNISLTGNAVANTIIGNDGDNVINGEAGDDVLDGGAGNDTIEGGEGADDLTGGEGNDVLNGGAGNDALYAGEGDDIVNTGSGNNLADGGEGNDTLTGGDGRDLIDGGEGNDIITTGANNDNLNGGGGNDTLDGGDGRDLIDGGAGNDIINGGAGNDDVVAAEGDDVVYGDAGNDVLYGDAGNDTLDGGEGGDFLDGGDGNDSLNGGAGEDSLFGGDGVDLASGYSDDAEISQNESGQWIVTDGNQTDVLEGIEKVRIGARTYLLVDDDEGNGFTSIQDAVDAATAGDVVLVGAGTYEGSVNVNKSVVIRGAKAEFAGSHHSRGAGESVVEGGFYVTGQNATIEGFSIVDGYESGSIERSGIIVQAQGVTVRNNVLRDQEGGLTDGSRGILVSTGSGQNLIITGNSVSGWSTGIYVNPGATGTISDNVLSGNNVGMSVDAPATELSVLRNAFLFNAFEQLGVGVSTTADVAALLAASNFFLGDVREVGIYSLDDTGQTVKGSSRADVFFGMGGNDSLDGGAGNDFIDGGQGNDSLDGGLGDDQLVGGLGNDFYLVDSALDTVTETTGAGTDTVRTTVNFTLSANVENLMAVSTSTTNVQLVGNDGANTITGNAGNNVLDGGGGADRLEGLGGNDTYVVDNVGDVVVEVKNGGTDTVSTAIDYVLGLDVENLTATGNGNISLTGNTLANTITGNAGNNVINGGAGKDVLSGGDGLDTFVFNTRLSATTNVDRVMSFRAADDVFNLENSVFTKVGRNNTFLATDAFFAGKSAGDREDRIIYDKSTGKLFYDADGKGGAAQVLFAQVERNTVLTKADFFII